MMESILWFEKMLSSTDPIPTSSLCSPTEDIIFEDSFANEIYMKFVDESSDDNHIDLFSEIDRNNEKIMLADEYTSANDYITPIASIDEEVKSNFNYNTLANNNDQFLMEFNSILDSVQLSNDLTPPQTPPLYQQNIPNGQYEMIYEEFQSNTESVSSSPIHEYIFAQNEASTSPPSSTSPISSYEESNQGDEIIFETIISSPADIQRELQVVDELVRAHSRHNSDIDDNNSVSAFSVASSVWSPQQSEYSNSSSSCSSQYGDDEPNARKSSSGLKGVTKKRPRAYGRNPDEKKYRKKEQNKNAATRYRQKKKQEIEVIHDEEKILTDIHRKLMSNYKDTKREVKYLKSLLRDLFKARGFIQ
jgi:cyclic AMP-dependent transcription factor ATF-4